MVLKQLLISVIHGIFQTCFGHVCSTYVKLFFYLERCEFLGVNTLFLISVKWCARKKKAKKKRFLLAALRTLSLNLLSA